jgi:hypothetical protein
VEVTPGSSNILKQRSAEVAIKIPQVDVKRDLLIEPVALAKRSDVGIERALDERSVASGDDDKIKRGVRGAGSEKRGVVTGSGHKSRGVVTGGGHKSRGVVTGGGHKSRGVVTGKGHKGRGVVTGKGHRSIMDVVKRVAGISLS